MPERNGLTRAQKAFTLVHADEHNMLVRVTCQHCRITRRYLAKDLLTLCGPVGIDEIPRWFRCEKCKEKRDMVADWESTYGEAIGKLRVWRLVKITYKRIPVWKDGVL
jgi:hypothetical protein